MPLFLTAVYLRAKAADRPMQEEGGQSHPQSFCFLLFYFFTFSTDVIDRSYWSMSALLIERQPEEPSGSVMVTATGLLRTVSQN